MPSRLAADSIVRQRAPLVDDGHGNQLPDWTAPVPLTITGCDVQPGIPQEYLGGRDTNLVRWTVYAPVDADVTATDRVDWDDDTYEVDGEPARLRGGRLAHCVILLKLWEG